MNQITPPRKSPITKIIVILAAIIVILMLFTSLLYNPGLYLNHSSPVSFINQSMVKLSFIPQLKPAAENTLMPIMLHLNSPGHRLVGVEIHLKYDPRYVAAVDIIPSNYFPQVTVIKPKIDQLAGTLNFTLLSPPDLPISGTNNLVLINFRTLRTTNSSTIELLPETKIAAVNIQQNLFQTTDAINIKIH
jgi:hypothetical protein